MYRLLSKQLYETWIKIFWTCSCMCWMSTEFNMAVNYAVPTTIVRNLLQRVYAQSFFWHRNSNQNTWLSATLDFSLVFRCFSAFSPILCTVVAKKTMLSCFGGFFPWFFKSKQLLGFLGVVYMLKQWPNWYITFV